MYLLNNQLKDSEYYDFNFLKNLHLRDPFVNKTFFKHQFDFKHILTLKIYICMK